MRIVPVTPRKSGNIQESRSTGISPGAAARAQETSWGSDLPLPERLRKELDRGELIYLAGPDACAVPARVYGGSGKKTPIILIHGLQSHSGWFAQSAAFLGTLGHPCYAMDRRGSGLSSAPRGDAKDFRGWSAEIAGVVEQVRRRQGHEQVYLLGHCFGAIPAALFAGQRPDLVRGAMLTTPGLHTRIGLPKAHLVKILLTLPGHRNYYLPVSLKTEWFTDRPDYAAFIAADPLALRAATGDFYWQIYRARKHLLKNPGQLTMPIWIGTAGKDPIADNARNLAWISQLPSRSKTLVHYQNARHILEFSEERERFFADLADWLARVETL